MRAREEEMRRWEVRFGMKVVMMMPAPAWRHRGSRGTEEGEMRQEERQRRKRSQQGRQQTTRQKTEEGIKEGEWEMWWEIHAETVRARLRINERGVTAAWVTSLLAVTGQCCIAGTRTNPSREEEEEEERQKGKIKKGCKDHVSEKQLLSNIKALPLTSLRAALQEQLLGSIFTSVRPPAAVKHSTAMSSQSGSITEQLTEEIKYFKKI